MGQAKSKDVNVTGNGKFQRLQPRDVPDDAVVLVVYVEKVDWPIDLGNPFVSAFIQPQLDDELKHQAQKSSVKPHARNPWWIPAERFEFIVAELDASRLVVEVSDHRGSRPGVTVAEGSVRLKKVAAAVEQTHRLKLFRTDNGQRENNGVLQVRLRIAPKEHYFNLVEDLVFEYARLEGPCRIDVAERDPGRFSDETGVLFFDRFRDAAPKMPPGFEIERPWEVESTPKNANGWQFARSFDSGWWYDEQFYGARACRRRWTRECRRAGQSVDYDIDDLILHVPSGYAKNKPPMPKPPSTTPPKLDGGACRCLCRGG